MFLLAIKICLILSVILVVIFFIEFNRKVEDHELARLPNPILKFHQVFDYSCNKNITKIGIFIAVTDTKMYKTALNSIQCYMTARGYSQLYLINLLTDSKVQKQCKNYEKFGFLRHCAVAAYLEETDWLFVLDADTAVINFEHCLEDFLQPGVDIIHYERFHNGEIAAGNYIARNSPAAKGSFKYAVLIVYIIIDSFQGTKCEIKETCDEIQNSDYF